MPDARPRALPPATLTWHLRLPGASAALRLRVEIEPPVRVADLRTALRRAVPGAARHTPMTVNGHRLDDDALLGHPPLLDGATLTLAGPSGPPQPRPLLAAHVVGGPDAGTVVDLPPGEHRIGRAAEASVRLTDPDVSRLHAVLEVSSQAVTVRDLHSGNGTEVDGSPAGVTATTLPIGARLRVGGTTLVLRTPDGVPAVVRADGRGHLLVSRQPDLAPAPGADPVAVPDPPTDPPPTRLPLLAAVLPALVSGALAVVLHSPTMLLFGLMSPVLVLGQWLADRRGSRRARREAHARYRRDRAEAMHRLDAALAKETAQRLAADPTPAEILATARRPGARLWDREPGRDGVRARVGVGVLDARTETTGGSRSVCRVGPVPVLVDLGAPGGLGILGPRDRTLRVAHAVVGSVAARYSPAELRIVVVHHPHHASDWAWVTDLPHAASADAIRGTTGQTPAGPRRDHPPPGLLVVLDGAAVDTGTALATALTAPSDHGYAVVSLGCAPGQLQLQCRTILDLAAATACLRADGRAPVPLEVDAVAPTWAPQLAGALAPLRDARAPADASDLPASVSLLRLLGLPDPTPAELLRRWGRQPRSTAVPLGLGEDGPRVVDLVRDGPHALIGGTTGAGKSELLASLVAGLGALNRPDELAFVLVDYKGGAAFGECVDLPHVVGLVTDLDASLTERALVSLGAELRRRERVLAEHGAPDFTAYHRDRPCGAGELPRLVVVVDELRVLADELPDFVTGLVRVAAQGRSLGVHLVVATQRPGGVVSADMRANLGLRVALRVRDAVDSVDLIETPTAAGLPADSPGRAYLRSPESGLRLLQTARITGHTPPAAPVRVTHVDDVPVAADPGGPSDLARLVRACRAAARDLGIAPVPPPWLAPLPDVVPVTTPATDPGVVTLGLADDPAGQRQVPLLWDPGRQGNLAVVGRSRSGRSTALRTVAMALASSLATTDLLLYAVHLGGLAGLPEWARPGGLVRGDEPADVERLLEVLREASPGSGPASPRVLVVDDWDRCLAALVAAGRPATADALSALARSGGPGAVVVVASGHRSLLVGATAGAFPRALVLLPADPVDLAVAGLPPRAHPADPPPGRAIDSRSGLFVQIATADPPTRHGDESPDPPTRHGDEPPAPPTRGGTGPAPASPAAGQPVDPRAPTLGEVGRTRPLPAPLRPLPVDVSVTALDGATVAVPVGLGGRELGPRGFDPGAGDRRIAVLGDRCSGRTTTLVTMARALARSGRPTVLLTGARPADLPSAVRALGPGDVEALVALRRAHPDLAVLVEELPGLDEGPMAPVLAEIERRLDEDGGVLVTAGSARRVVESGLGLVARVARHGCGLLLGPGQPGDERALGRRGIPACGSSPGRAVLVRAAGATAVQVARTAGPHDATTRPP